MLEKLTIFVCDDYRAEVELVKVSENLKDLEFQFFPSDCFHCVGNIVNSQNGVSIKCMYYLSYKKSKEGHDKGCDIINENDNPMGQPLIGASLAQSLIKEGNYLVTAGWLKKWENYFIKQQIFEPGYNEQKIGEEFNKILLLDSGITKDYRKELEEFAGQAGLPFGVLYVGLDYFRANLMQLYQTWKIEQYKIQAEEKTKQVSDFALTIDVLGDIANLLKQDELINRIFEFFVILTGANQLCFIPVYEGVIKSTIFYKENIYRTQDNTDFCEMYKLLPSGKGFIFKLNFNNILLGYLEVDNIKFPQYINRYIDLVQLVIDIFSLTLFNSRIYEELIKANEELKNFNLQLEAVVKERTAQLIEMNEGLGESNASLEEANALLEEEIEERKKARDEILLLNEKLLMSNDVLKLEIIEHKKTELQLKTAKNEAEKANEAKSNFLANMSHEIRTPMNGILGMTELTLMTNLDEEQKLYLNLVKKSTNALLRIINDILDYTKIEADAIVLENRPFCMKEVIRETIQLFDFTAKEKELTITCSVDDGIPDIIYGDELKLEQILSNLLGNAIKFTSVGSVGITVQINKINKNKIELLFTISDTGIGIKADQIELLFTRFTQLDSTKAKHYQGTGLGLAITKKLIEKMNGNIWIQSEVNIGSSFYFTLEFEYMDVEQ